MPQLTLHANAVNLARRLTVSNENDLLQESYVGEKVCPSVEFYLVCFVFLGAGSHGEGLRGNCLYLLLYFFVSRTDTDDDMKNSKKYSHDYCHELAQHLIHTNALPMECRKYIDVVSDLKRRDTDTSHPTQWMG